MGKRNYEQKPLAKKDFVVVEELPNEALVYDSAKNRLHALTPIATTVWKNCDGKTTVSNIADKLKMELNDELGEDLTWLSLEELEKNGLLEIPVSIPKTDISRRDLIKRAALAATISLPLITTLIAPSPARAQSVGVGMMEMMEMMT